MKNRGVSRTAGLMKGIDEEVGFEARLVCSECGYNSKRKEQRIPKLLQAGVGPEKEKKCLVNFFHLMHGAERRAIDQTGMLGVKAVKSMVTVWQSII